MVSPQQRWGMDLQKGHADPCTETTRLHPSLPFPARQYPLPWSILSCPDALPGSSTAHEWLQWLQGPAAQAGPQMHETRTRETSLPLRDATGTITAFSEASFAVVPRQELSVCLATFQFLLKSRSHGRACRATDRECFLCSSWMGLKAVMKGLISPSWRPTFPELE